MEFTVTESGDVLMRGLTAVPSDQRWFWDIAWQTGEQEASREIAAGDVTSFDSAEEMFDSLER